MTRTGDIYALASSQWVGEQPRYNNDIECNKDKTNNIATKKNIGFVIENDIINFQYL
jgi:hypothetical protein